MCRTEEYLRNRFEARREEKLTNALPKEVSKFISTMKHSVRASMRNKGGTAFSVIRQMFLYWDRDRTGRVNAKDLGSCMSSLGIRISAEEIRAIIKHYNSKDATPGGDSMSYSELLQDVQSGEPSLLEYVVDDEVVDELPNERYAFEKDKFAVQPPLVKMFIQAIRLTVMRKMLRDGGTPFSIVRQTFMHFDLNLSSALNADELILAMRKGMGLVFSEEHCAVIQRFYNRDNSGEFGYKILLKDIVQDFPSMLDFTATSDAFFNARGKEVNPFIPKNFLLSENKAVASIKARLVAPLARKIATKGGSQRSHLLDAFLFWDTRCLGKLKDPKHVIGALKRVGIDVSADEVQLLMRRYDKDRDGELNYDLLIADVTREEQGFLADGRGAFDASLSPTQRSPANVANIANQIKSKADAFATKTGGRLVPRDILHGRFCVADPALTGHVTLSTLRTICKDLHASIGDAKLQVLLSWFDSNGSNTMDYNAFIQQLYGADAPSFVPLRIETKSEGNGNFIKHSEHTSPPKKVPTKKLSKLREEDARRLDRLAQMRSEKLFIKSKLASIDTQKRELQDLHKK